jgi:hypothetical protein
MMVLIEKFKKGGENKKGIGYFSMGKRAMGFKKILKEVL